MSEPVELHAHRSSSDMFTASTATETRSFSWWGWLRTLFSLFGYQDRHDESTTDNTGNTEKSDSSHEVEVPPCPNEFTFLPIVPPDLPNYAKKKSMRTDQVELQFASKPQESVRSTKGIHDRARTVTTANTTTVSESVMNKTVGTASIGSIDSTSVPSMTASEASSRFVGVDTLGGIYDPNSWGQHLGGTDRMNVSSHIIFFVHTVNIISLILILTTPSKVYIIDT
jgi:hypothetical protein